ncbi:ergothioneine biosynthesis protein EgtB [Kangiella spongicola]|uniref:Ergothioneine biosynthesis protein EgtB n=1 Tax=Kangiella spongicola TaxID=796379 RepID=A0A318D290_9GAMM|nr:ergothioneine biosynthesis protein EgtB [Kangiella spongicola]PXF62933.1 ergothioneine biosynthesis protein EgtB [Kangiella spongicola]
MLDKVDLSSLQDKVLNDDMRSLIERFKTVREVTEALCEPLEVEDLNLQAVAETSPAKWHLAHTSWFFETFILKSFEENFVPFNPQFEYLFNSYYNAIGEQFLRPNRHLLSRPTVSEIYDYRKNVTERIVTLIEKQSQLNKIAPLVTLGINHEQQHQELLLTDIKYNLYQNPLLPVYLPLSETLDGKQSVKSSPKNSINWVSFDESLVEIGKELGDGVNGEFGFDNESPKHQCFVAAFEISERLITNGEYLEFIEAGGYDEPKYWLSDGWAKKTDAAWQAPLYWYQKDGYWYQYSLTGNCKLDPNEPVSHISYYEADAFATWAGARLPTEQEWELVAKGQPVSGNLLASKNYRPTPTAEQKMVKQLYGDLWEWTSSSYSPYPGYSPLAGAVGEYNGKFMANQYVLRGGSCVTSDDHIRATYRNFFYPEARWQFSGLRLARSL